MALGIDVEKMRERRAGMTGDLGTKEARTHMLAWRGQRLPKEPEAYLASKLRLQLLFEMVLWVMVGAVRGRASAGR